MQWNVIDRERSFAKTAFVNGIPSVIPYDTVKVGDCLGVVFELLRSDTLGHAMRDNPDKLEAYVDQYVELAKTLHSTHVPAGSFSRIQDVMHTKADNLNKWCSEKEMALLHSIIDSIPDSDTVTHNDLHPGNIMIQDGELVLYDFGMEVGDRFRSVDGKEDITVVEKRKVWQPSTHTNQTELDVLVLSNGCMLVENLGYLDMDVSVFDLSATGSFFDYLNQDKGYRMQLVLSYWNKKLIFDDWLDGGTSGIETTPANGIEQETGAYCDLMGRRLPSQPKQGVYIQNGKKFVIK
jgi:serine/threonine protein kinase